MSEFRPLITWTHDELRQRVIAHEHANDAARASLTRISGVIALAEMEDRGFTEQDVREVKAALARARRQLDMVSYGERAAS